MLIPGFSTYTDYNCKSCHAKCCATEYDLPLVGSEKRNLQDRFPEISLYLQSSTFGDHLIRGDACSFLTREGACQIHDTKYKPISCEIYPLIIWRFSQDDTLVWINPCRGRGFTWHSDDKSKLNEEYLQKLILSSKDYFKTYWGEEIDRNNPYKNLPISRVYEQIDYFNSIEKKSILQNLLEKNQTTRYRQITDQLESNWLLDPDYDHIRDLIDSVLIWLSWSPVGLQLYQSNSQQIFSMASLMVIQILLGENSFDLTKQNNSIYLNHVGSYLATSLLPSFWQNIKLKFKNKYLVRFSEKVFHVLNGSNTQQAFLEYMDK